MKSLNNFVSEALRINKDIQTRNYTEFPKTKEELRDIIKKRYAELNQDDANTLDLNDIDVSAIKDFSDLFENVGDTIRRNVKILHMPDWEVSNASNLSYMFRDLRYIEEIHIENWNITDARKLIGLFSLCDELKTVDLSSWNPRSAQSMKYMFYRCEHLTSIGNISNWNIKQCLDFTRMFAECRSLKLDLSSWKFNKKANKKEINACSPAVTLE